MALTYPSYLELETLLDLQKPRSTPPEHDEMLFIIVHQVYELWFKLLLHECEKIRRDFESNDLYGALHTLKRVRTVMKTLVGQMDILETMTPMSFTSFRDRLETASGFQSHQYRELEFLLGFKREGMIKFHQDNPAVASTLRRRLEEPSLNDAFQNFLKHHGVKLPPNAEPAVHKQALQQGLLNLYKNKPELAVLFELMTDFDEGFQEWRYRHVKLVERTIGNKTGTGGTLGVAFLKQSLFIPFFPDLWDIRHQL